MVPGLHLLATHPLQITWSKARLLETQIALGLRSPRTGGASGEPSEPL